MPTRWLKLTVAYDGGAYAGWQVQPDKPTVQGVVEAAWCEITQESVRLTAAGRTDAGVHALGQVAGVVTESQLSTADLQRGLNAMLPDDVAILAVEEARQGFHATHDAIGKRYCYHIHNARLRSVFNRHYAWHYPQPLDAAVMHVAGQGLVGRHDFSSFESAGSERPDAVRTITELAVARGRESFATGEHATSLSTQSQKTPDPFLVTIEIAGDGFLYNMVRAIVGTLIEVGRGARGVDWPREVLAAQDRRRAGQTVPPHGLFLVSVDYD